MICFRTIFSIYPFHLCPWWLCLSNLIYLVNYRYLRASPVTITLARHASRWLWNSGLVNPDKEAKASNTVVPNLCQWWRQEVFVSSVDLPRLRKICHHWGTVIQVLDVTSTHEPTMWHSNLHEKFTEHYHHCDNLLLWHFDPVSFYYCNNSPPIRYFQVTNVRPS
jgi:hypothetical protein